MSEANFVLCKFGSNCDILERKLIWNIHVNQHYCNQLNPSFLCKGKTKLARKSQIVKKNCKNVTNLNL